MKEDANAQRSTRPQGKRPDGTEPGMRLRLPLTDEERQEADFFMDVPRAGAAERLAAAERKRKAGL